ncbi:hypothetical protein D1BOALGB6SA_6794 [Olavius sp. associated proteobacterium Delta 1]|nr:hypothetical protein D1BOALGB6SA_6794 [Olavius sp. associated proteobacterium Delta 1]
MHISGSVPADIARRRFDTCSALFYCHNVVMDIWFQRYHMSLDDRKRDFLNEWCHNLIVGAVFNRDLLGLAYTCK